VPDVHGARNRGRDDVEMWQCFQCASDYVENQGSVTTAALRRRSVSEDGGGNCLSDDERQRAAKRNSKWLPGGLKNQRFDIGIRGNSPIAAGISFLS
jgi:hypothetical protein